MSPQRYERVRISRLPTPLRSSPVSTRSPGTNSTFTQVSVDDQDDTPITLTTLPNDAPNTPPSPPPSFRSLPSSPSSRQLLTSQDPIASDAERTLNDTFNDGSDSEDESAGDDRQRLMRSNTTQTSAEQQQNNNDRPALPRTVTTLPPSNTPAALGAALAAPTRRPAFFNPSQNDGVFANLDAKPERGEKLEEQPPVSHPPSLDLLQFLLKGI